jgi:hypothetical protein
MCVCIAPIDPVVVTMSFASQLFRLTSGLSGAAVHTPVCVCACVCLLSSRREDGKNVCVWDMPVVSFDYILGLF